MHQSQTRKLAHLRLYRLLLLALVACLPGCCFAEWPQGSILARFRNLAESPINLFWINTEYHSVEANITDDLRFFGTLEGNGGITSFTTYSGHRFLWCLPGEERTRRVERFGITEDRTFYFHFDRTTKSTDYQRASDEVKFLSNFYREHGYHWLSPMNRPPPVLPILDANGAEVHVESGTFKCDPWKTGKVRVPNTQIKACQNYGDEFHAENVRMESPKVFEVMDFVSEFEAQHIVELARPFLRTAMVGEGQNARVDPTRKCTSIWIAMNRTRILEAIYRRIGATLQIDGSYMTAAAATGWGKMGVASHMEVSRFRQGGHYNPHYDNAPLDEPYLHLLTFQIVLKVSEDLRGGDTLFRDLRLPAEERSAVFWYNLDKTGNLDRDSMYSTDNVECGEVWFAHVSIWDPHLPPKGDPRMPHARVYSFHDEL